MNIVFLRMKKIYGILIQLVFQQEGVDPEIFCENKLDNSCFAKRIWTVFFPFFKLFIPQNLLDVCKHTNQDGRYVYKGDLKKPRRCRNE